MKSYEANDWFDWNEYWKLYCWNQYVSRFGIKNQQDIHAQNTTRMRKQWVQRSLGVDKTLYLYLYIQRRGVLLQICTLLYSEIHLLKSWNGKLYKRCSYFVSHSAKIFIWEEKQWKKTKRRILNDRISIKRFWSRVLMIGIFSVFFSLESAIQILYFILCVCVCVNSSKLLLSIPLFSSVAKTNKNCIHQIFYGMLYFFMALK